MMRLNRLIICLVGLFGASCSHFDQPPLANRYRSLDAPRDDECRSVVISGFALPAVDPEKPTTIGNLDGRGQATLLAELSKKIQDPAAFVRAAASPLAPTQSAAPIQDNTRFKRRVVLSLENRSGGPADRVAFARILLELPEAGDHEFVGWNKLQTEFAQVDVAKLKRDERATRSLDTKVSGSYAGVSAEAAPRFSEEQGLSEEVALRQRYVALTGTLTSKHAEILQQSVSGVDLTGNVVIDLEVKAGEDEVNGPVLVTVVSNLTDKEGNPTPQEKVSIATKLVRIADADAAPVEAAMALSYRIREVVTGDATIMEGDDVVAFASSKNCPVTSKLVLLTQDDLKFTTWQLMSTDGDSLVAVDRVSGDSGSSHPKDINMESNVEAFELLSWMMSSSSGGELRLASRKLYLCPYAIDSVEACVPLTRAAARKLTVTDWDWNWTRKPGLRRPLAAPEN